MFPLGDNAGRIPAALNRLGLFAVQNNFLYSNNKHWWICLTINSICYVDTYTKDTSSIRGVNLTFRTLPRRRQNPHRSRTLRAACPNPSVRSTKCAYQVDTRRFPYIYLPNANWNAPRVFLRSFQWRIQRCVQLQVLIELTARVLTEYEHACTCACVRAFDVSTAKTN